MGKLLWQRAKQSRELLERSRQGACELRQQHVARRNFGQNVDLLDGEPLIVEDAAFDHQGTVGPGKVLKRFGYRHGITRGPISPLTHEGDRRRPCKQVLQVKAQVPHGKSHQGVLVDLVVAAGLAESMPEGSQ